jgi:anti-sigma regulatory factor (Ser/Thr protein kinase)
MTRRSVQDDLADVGAAISWASAITAAAGVPPDVRFSIELCLEEALANLIMHGRPTADGKQIVLAVDLQPDGVRVEIGDACEAFDVTEKVSGPDDDGRRDGGRGIGLLKSFAANMAYETKGRTNTLTLWFPVPG